MPKLFDILCCSCMLYLPFKQNSSVLLYHVSMFDTFTGQLRHKAINPWQLAGSLASYVHFYTIPKVGINFYFEGYKFYQIGPWSKVCLSLMQLFG